MTEQNPEPTEAPSTDPATEAPAPGEKDRTPAEPPSAVDAGVPHVEDAAPENLDTDPASSVHTEGDGDNEPHDVTQPVPMQDQEAPKIQGTSKDQQKALERGYFGETAADRDKAAQPVTTNAEAVEALASEQDENEEQA